MRRYILSATLIVCLTSLISSASHAGQSDCFRLEREYKGRLAPRLICLGDAAHVRINGFHATGKVEGLFQDFTAKVGFGPESWRVEPLAKIGTGIHCFENICRGNCVSFKVMGTPFVARVKTVFDDGWLLIDSGEYWTTIDQVSKSMSDRC